MKKKLGEILIAQGAVTRADLEAALSDQNAGEPARLGDLLVSLGKITTLQLARALSQQYGVKFTHVPEVPREVLEAVPLDVQRRFRFLPLSVAQASISIALADLSHASSDVLPVLKKRWATVNLFVAPSDEIDAVHAQHEALAPVAPVPPPTRSPAPRKPVVTASDDELFAALDLALPSDPAPEPVDDLEVLSGLEPLPPAEAPPESFELEVPDPPPAPAPARAEEEEAWSFEAAPAALLTTDLGEQAEGPPVVAGPLAEDLFGDPLAEEVAVDLEVAATDPGLRATVAAPAPPVPDDQPFFETAPQAVPIATLEDDAFLPGVPMSSGSSLAQLVIQPEAAPLTVVPPVNLPRPPAAAARPGAFARKAVPASSGSGLTPIPAPEPLAPRVPAGSALPAWLKGSGAGAPPAEGTWTGALDELAPSRLIQAVTRALIRRGLLTEQEILDAVAARKKDPPGGRG